MPLELLEAAKLNLSDSLVSRVASSLGENELNIRRAFKSAVPAILGGLLHKTSRSGEESTIMSMLKDIAGSGAINSLPELLEAKKSSSYAAAAAAPGYGIHSMIPEWQKTVFGPKLINIINAVSIYAEIKSSTANTVLNIATPVALAPIAQYAVENGLSFSDIESLLQNQKSSILKAIPSGFNLTGSLGIDNLEDIGTKIITTIPEPHEHQQNKEGFTIGRWVWPLLILLTFGALYWFFSRNDDAKMDAKADIADSSVKSVATIPVDTSKAVAIAGSLDSITGDFIYDHGVLVELKLPDSSTLRAGVNSTEARLFKMLSDTGWKIDTIDKTKNWVSFDRVFFKTGKSVLTPESEAQLNNIATLLKNFPASSIKIGGYTDNTGDSVTNKKISEERARTVLQELLQFGAGVRQLTEAVGYGPEFPVCPANDTPECKARNRRVDLKVSSK
jgi:OOP family OmpA-OmpF porin